MELDYDHMKGSNSLLKETLKEQVHKHMLESNYMSNSTIYAVIIISYRSSETLNSKLEEECIQLKETNSALKGTIKE